MRLRQISDNLQMYKIHNKSVAAQIKNDDMSSKQGALIDRIYLGNIRL